MTRLTNLRKMANTTHNAADSLYSIHVFLRRSGLNSDNKYNGIDQLACDISDCMRGVKHTLNMLERYQDGNPHKCSPQYVFEGLKATIRNLNHLWRKLPEFDYKSQFDEYNNLIVDCRCMLLSLEEIADELKEC